MKSFIPALSDLKKCRLKSRFHAYVGIDFGTSNTVVSVCGWDDLQDDLSIWTLAFDRTPSGAHTPLIPTVIYVEGERFLIGQNAKHRGELVGVEKRNYIRSFKMELGYEGGAQYHQFEIGNNSEKRESVLSKLNQIIGRRGKSISGDILKIDCPKKATEAFFGILKDFIEEHCKIKFPSKSLKYSVSIPACFGSNQRRDYRLALEGAGIKVDDRFFIDEPNAAFLSWLADDSKQDKPTFQTGAEAKNVLIFDFGAGTCDLSILGVSSKEGTGLKLKNLALSRFSALGGDDLDKEIARRFLFPSICELNKIEPDLIPPHVYREHFEPKLQALAERIKIRASNRINRENVSPEDRVLFQLDGPIEIEIPIKWYDRFTRQGVRSVIVPEELALSFGDFEEAIYRFIGGRELSTDVTGEPLRRFFRRLTGAKPVNEQSILDLLENVVSKAGIKKQDIDYLLFIGGSSNLRYVQEAVVEFFEEAPEVIIPDDIQTHVSRGVALHSFLSHGLQENPLTEILAEDIYLLVKGGEQLVFKAGTEIPASAAVGSLYKTDRRQREVEFPFLAGCEKRIVARVSTKLPPNVSADDEITLEAQIDSHKIVHLRARYDGGTLLQGEEISPFGQQALDEYSQTIGALRAALNDALAKEGFVVGEDSLQRNRKKFLGTSICFDELVDLMHKHGDYYGCLGLLEECCPDNYVNLSFYASHAGEKSMALVYTKKAYEVEPNGVSAYNLAISYPQTSAEYLHHLEEACHLGHLSAKVVLAERLRITSPERAASLMSEASAHYRTRFENNPDGLQSWEYTWIRRISEYEVDDDLKLRLKQSEQRRKNATKSQHREFNEKKLLIARNNANHGGQKKTSAVEPDDFEQI